MLLLLRGRSKEEIRASAGIVREDGEGGSTVVAAMYGLLESGLLDGQWERGWKHGR